MCRLKSGIILKTICVLAEGLEESHAALLDELAIEDTMENAMKNFVRAELVPLNGKWWTDPATWKFRTD